jgi:hypothetical protein
VKWRCFNRSPNTKSGGANGIASCPRDVGLSHAVIRKVQNSQAPHDSTPRQLSTLESHHARFIRKVVAVSR